MEHAKPALTSVPSQPMSFPSDMFSSALYVCLWFGPSVGAHLASLCFRPHRHITSVPMCSPHDFVEGPECPDAAAQNVQHFHPINKPINFIELVLFSTFRPYGPILFSMFILCCRLSQARNIYIYIYVKLCVHVWCFRFLLRATSQNTQTKTLLL